MRLLVNPPALSFLLCAIFAVSSSALLVAPSSQCTVQCGNVLTSTTGSDLTCTDASYASTVAGQTFQNCISCELRSTYVDSTTKQTDLQWLLYNLRYTLSWCLWGYPNNTNFSDTPCITSTACGSLTNAIEYDSLSTNTSEFGYCSLWNSANLYRCTTCLLQFGTENYLANYMMALAAGCQQLPSPGSQISLDGTLFQSSLVNIITPVNSSAPTYTPPPSGPLTLNNKVGIAIGGLIFLILLSGCFIVCRGKRRRRAHLKKLARASYNRNNHEQPAPAWKEYHSPGTESEISRAFMSPDNHRWQGGNDDSPQSARSDRVFSPYTSQYSSPVGQKPPDGERIYEPVPIPRAYDERGNGNSEVRYGEHEIGHSRKASGTPIELSGLSPIVPVASRASVPPIIKEPVPTHGKDKGRSTDEQVGAQAQAQEQVAELGTAL